MDSSADWINTLANVVEAAAVAGAALVAVRSLNAWRHQLVATKRSELAEATLAMFYEARDNIAAARGLWARAGEGSTRPREPRDEYEPEHHVNYRNALYAPAERLTKQAEFWGRFLASRYRFMAVFGEETAKPYHAIWQVKARVIVAATALVRAQGWPDEAETSEDRRRQRRQQREKWESDIWGGSPAMI